MRSSTRKAGSPPQTWAGSTRMAASPSPAEVAAILETCPSVREAAVFGEPDSQYGQRVTAVVVPASLATPPRLEELRAAVRRKLPAYAAPRALLIIPAMPLLPSGKPDLATLRGLGRDATT